MKKNMSLTTTAKNTKKAFLIFTAISIIYLLGRYLIVPTGKSIYASIFPPKNPPNPIFGVLPPLQFESQKILGTQSPQYLLNTTTGKLPGNLPTRMTVYKYAPAEFSYEAGKKAVRHAETLGFTENMLTTSLKGNTYEWVEPQTGANLTIEINSDDLMMQTPKEAYMLTYAEGSINKMAAISKAKEILNSVGRFSDPLYRSGNQKAELGSIENGTIKYTTYAPEAEIAVVDFFRSINKYPIVGPIYEQGLIRLYIGNPSGEGNVAKILSHPNIQYYNREIVVQSNATYPIIPVTTAWGEIVKGMGIISYVKPNTQSPFEEYKPVNISQILVNDISLAYYDDREGQAYLQPIYVFEGNYLGPTPADKGEIVLYYPAVSGEYVKKATPAAPSS